MYMFVFFFLYSVAFFLTFKVRLLLGLFHRMFKMS